MFELSFYFILLIIKKSSQNFFINYFDILLIFLFDLSIFLFYIFLSIQVFDFLNHFNVLVLLILIHLVIIMLVKSIIIDIFGTVVINNNLLKCLIFSFLRLIVFPSILNISWTIFIKLVYELKVLIIWKQLVIQLILILIMFICNQLRLLVYNVLIICNIINLW